MERSGLVVIPSLFLSMANLSSVSATNESVVGPFGVGVAVVARAAALGRNDFWGLWRKELRAENQSHCAVVRSLRRG